jgi:hypothetical protein
MGGTLSERSQPINTNRGRYVMLDQLNEIDWVKLGHPEIKTFIENAVSPEPQISQQALNQLKDAIAPWELLDGYGTTDHLMKMSRSPVPELVIPFLIDLLELETIKNKVFLLEILYDLSRYHLVSKDFIPLDEVDRYMQWAERLREFVRTHTHLYIELTNHSSPDIQQAAADLIDFIIGTAGDDRRRAPYVPRKVIDRRGGHAT